ncbi:tellurite resistance TerB family protein [Okeania sp.]|uniref:tellurite resistance TerB family protein n=1 Tax=Okeania sp. TaxID=3100323 RepID=UPI002B4AC792|nr:tellurite resistance TerB family protein [Okeania sp.]MEB3342033.1 tellurite resistance TerB family protein [Okeania sp.]
MGLFDRVHQSESLKSDNVRSEIILGPAESFAAIMLVVISADNYLADVETDLLLTFLGRMQLFRNYSSEVMERMFDKLGEIQKKKGDEALIDAAFKSLPHDLYETAFAIATDLVLSDGQVTKEEEELLESLCEALDIPEKRVNEIIRVMLIKNQG